MTITNAVGAGTTSGPVASSRNPRRLDTTVLLAAFTVLVAVETALFVFAYLPGERAQAVEAWKGRLVALADDRGSALVVWVRGRTADARVVAAYPTVAELVAAGAGAVLPPSIADGAQTHLAGLLAGIVQTYRYQGAYVLDARGAEVARSAGSPPLAGACLAAARRTLDTGATTLDFYPRDDGTPLVAVTAPVAPPAPGAPSRAPVGVVVLTADPGGWLYPVLLAQPVPTSTGEALLVRRDGDRVQFLSPLRFRNAAPLTYSRPLDAPGFAAQEVVEGHQGFFATADYRGVPVFAATRMVAGTPWGLVVKVDRSEALAPFRRRVVAMASFLGLVTAALGLAGVGFWRSRRARFEAALARSEARFAHLFEHANDAVVVSRPDGRILAVNARAEALYGHPRAELLALAVRDLRAPETLPQLDGQVRQVLEGNGLVFETVHIANDGTLIPVEVSSRRFVWEGGPVLFSIVRDIRERRAAEERIRFLNRLLRTISEINQLVVRERDRGRLLAEACRILVEHGEFHMAWVGLVEVESGRVVPAAIAGFDDGYLAASEIRFDDSPGGRGPTGTAVRERRPVVANDWERDERMGPWRAAGRERGYRASAAVPLETGGAAVGAVTVYADRAGVFTDEVVKLLVELAGDLSFALDAIEAERQKTAASAALAASEESFRAFFDNAPIGKAMTSPEGHLVRVNPALCRFLGYSAEELERLSFETITHPGDLAASRGVLRALLAGELPSSLEKRYLASDGRVVWAQVVIRLQRDAEGRPLYFLTHVFDITERKRAEDEVRRLYDELERRVADRTAELQAANAELEAFSYSVSHDLRAPLRSIDGFSRIVEEEYGGSLDDEGRRLLRVVRDNTHRMARLIDDLLAFSRSARHPLQPVRVDMGALVRSVCEEVVSPEVRAGCELTVAALPDAVGDVAMLRQVWVNLLSNAVKFSRPVARPTITVGGRLEGREVVYTVSDNGVGFDMTYAGKLFGVFQRLHPASQFEGTGVGLALVQRIVHRHGGRVWADGAVGQGATFSFALPAPGGAS